MPNSQKDQKQGKHPVLLHAVYNEEGSVCPYKCGGWSFLIVLCIVVVCVAVSRSGKWRGATVDLATEKVVGGGAIRTLAPSADELLSELSSF